MLQDIAAMATIATPIMVAFFAGIGWLIQNGMSKRQSEQESRLGRIRDLEDKLRDDRVSAYDKLLAPFFLLLTTDAAFASDKKYTGKDKNKTALDQMLSVEYRMSAFKLSLIATDNVVKAYNALTQYFYHSERSSYAPEEKTAVWIGLFGTLLHEIRRSMGNETTGLDRWQMVEWWMRDAEEMKKTEAKIRLP